MSIKVDEVLATKDDKERAIKMIDMFNKSTSYMDNISIEEQLKLEEGYTDVVHGLIYAFGECLDNNVVTNAKEFYDLERKLV